MEIDDTGKNTIYIQSDKAFPDFNTVLNDLKRFMNIDDSNTKAFIGEYPGDFSFCKNDSGEKRKYIVADIKIKNKYENWLVIDVENTIHSSALMLIIRKSSKLGEDAESQASKLIEKLVYIGNGHWTSSCFDEVEKLRIPYNTLRHNKNRSPYIWAKYISEKIDKLQHK
ncbi:MAG TPA: hypothetical protein GXZ65_05020 [Clostridiales bacterium]|nr:hypothetical protein [Clostridiales bacterium]